MNKESSVLALMNKIRKDFNIGDPKYPEQTLIVSDLEADMDVYFMLDRARSLIRKLNLTEEEQMNEIQDLYDCCRAENFNNVLIEVQKLFPIA